MKRDFRLRRLSDDHHQALVLARRATAAASGSATACVSTWSQVVRRFRDDLAPHFFAEERYLLPEIARSGGVDMVRRTLDEHAELRRLIHEDPSPVAHRLARFGSLLRDHVRFEERELFPFAEQRLDAAALDALARAYGMGPTQRQPESKG